MMNIDVDAQRRGQAELRISAPRQNKAKAFVVKEYPQKVLVIDNFIDQSTCTELCEYLVYKLDHDKGFSHTNCNTQFSNVLVPSTRVDNAHIKALVLDIIDRKHQLIRQQFVEPMAKQFPDTFEGVALHHDSSDLVRWSPTSNPSLGEHADNQFWDMPEKPHYSAHRDWSSVLYLNSDFEGGEFYFKNPHIPIAPKAGRLVVFGSGIEYIHGVKPVTSGARYTFPSWWTYGNRPESRVTGRAMPSPEQLQRIHGGLVPTPVPSSTGPCPTPAPPLTSTVHCPTPAPMPSSSQDEVSVPRGPRGPGQ